ncbi:MAG: hypothetical protein ABID54_12345 [Pseudomonadota bacterium]
MTESEQRVLASLPSTEYGRVLFKFIAKVLEIDREEVRIGAKICDSPLCEDIRWKLGGISKLEQLEVLPKMCDEILSSERRRV